MNILRNEIRTGLLVVLSLAALVAVLLYLGAPGVFVPQHTFRIYFDNASGIKPGASVLLAGRQIGQVRSLFSPVPEKDRPTPKMETLIEVQVEQSARIYKRVKALMTSNGLLGQNVIDFTNGEEASGLAEDGATFLGERPPDLSEIVPAVLERLDPALAKATATLESLQNTADNLTKMTQKDADLPVAMMQFRVLGANLSELSGPGGALRKSLANVEALTSEQGALGQSLSHLAGLTAPEGSLAQTLRSTEKFAASLEQNKDIPLALKNFRLASENLNQTLDQLGGKFSLVGSNLEQASDTVKRQPWRLIWPSTKNTTSRRPLHHPQCQPDPGARPVGTVRARAGQSCVIFSSQIRRLRKSGQRIFEGCAVICGAGALYLWAQRFFCVRKTSGMAVANRDCMFAKAD